MLKRLVIFTLAIICTLTGLLPVGGAFANSETKAAIVFPRSIVQIDDKSFIAAVREGALRATKELGIPLRIYMQDNSEDDVKFLTDVAKDGASVIIGMSFVDTSPLLKVAEQFPNVKFVIVDGVVPPLFTNAKSIIFREHEGSFLVGMIAALKSKTGKVGFIGGRDIPIIRNFAGGFVQGAKYVNPQIDVVVEFMGPEFENWDNPAKAERMAKAQFKQKVDIIFTAAGASSLGVLKAAAETPNAYAIGVDSNQNHLYPGKVLTSMVKRTDVAIYEALKNVRGKQWDAGILNLGLKEKALDYAVDENNKHLLDGAIISIVENARKQIIDGGLVVQMYSPAKDTTKVR